MKLHNIVLDVFYDYRFCLNYVSDTSRNVVGLCPAVNVFQLLIKMTC